MKKIQNLDLTYTRHYKNAELEIVCEDDTLTTARIFIGGDFHGCYDINGDEGVANTKKNIDEVFNNLKLEVDKEFEKTLASIAKA